MTNNGGNVTEEIERVAGTRAFLQYEMAPVDDRERILLECGFGDGFIAGAKWMLEHMNKKEHTKIDTENE